AGARGAEPRCERAAALDCWRRALALVPIGTKQHAGISSEVERLTATLPAGPPPSTPASAPQWVQRLGPVAVVLFAGWKLIGVGEAAAVSSPLASLALVWTPSAGPSPLGSL